MPPDLRLVPGAAPDPSAPLASFTHDPRLPSLVAKIAAVLLVPTALCAWLMASLDPSIRIALGAFAGLEAVLAVWQAFAALGRGAVRYTLTAQRLALERGLFGKRHESVELWRIRDVVLDQSVVDRMRGAGTITVFSTDQVEPVLTIGPVAAAKSTYESIRDAAQAARRAGGVVTLQQ